MGGSNSGMFKHWHSYCHSYGRCLTRPFKHQHVQTLAPELWTSAAEGRRGKSFSGCRGADVCIQLYAPNFLFWSVRTKHVVSYHKCLVSYHLIDTRQDSNMNPTVRSWKATLNISQLLFDLNTEALTTHIKSLNLACKPPSRVIDLNT